jgi:4-hydroxyphenylacetate 3-hydroxylase C terminal
MDPRQRLSDPGGRGTKVEHLIEQTIVSHPIYLNSHPRNFSNRKQDPISSATWADRNGVEVEEHVKLMKLLWESLASQYGGQDERYEIKPRKAHGIRGRMGGRACLVFSRRYRPGRNSLRFTHLNKSKGWL